ncbi:MAG TPA: 3-deoxy-8-phosphooctulonate synthase [Candidatus Krumholzibacteria bacterium]|nr:3-deoxy-8-phosphooctulonate synthase [Candidatus Krumholzibacteria bacterium]HPD71283.1 3-deoxy-8-phosphooctulonate synthase [Candidatus Krumholzibacteria bacterium]HRY39017.1 3-deoxy-8-phosphooctulonate synthase [Candidatus Krumholzibacteria bacterium]
METAAPIGIGGQEVGRGRPLYVIAGPCVLEDPDEMLLVAERLAAACRTLGLGYCFKSSYLKDNRTSGASFRGPGPQEGLALLDRIRREVGVAVVTDVHGPEDCADAAAAVDVLQIPAFLCRQTSLLEAAGRTRRAVNIKKGQFLAPADLAHAAAKVAGQGCDRILLTERGSFFGYRDLVVDFRSIKLMQDLGRPVVFDATHSVQMPGSTGTATGGKREFIPLLAGCGVTAGADAIFLEVHPEPARAFCDAASQLPLAEFAPLVRRLARLRELHNEETA